MYTGHITRSHRGFREFTSCNMAILVYSVFARFTLLKLRFELAALSMLIGWHGM